MLGRLSFLTQLKWLFVLCLVIFLLAIINGLPESQVMAQSITITPPSGKTGFILSPNTSGQSLITTTGLVTSDVTYDVAVRDKMEDSKAGTDAGQMVSWAAGSYDAGVKIADVVYVNTTHGSAVVAGLPHDVTATDFTIIDAATAATNDDLLITVAVDTVTEPALNPPSVYKITLTFTASADT